MNLDYPFHFDAAGHTATTPTADHVRDMIEQLLFTSPGERVNRPDFGSGVLQLSVRAAIETWLGDVVEVQALEVTSEDSTLRIYLEYVVRSSGERRSDTFERSAS